MGRSRRPARAPDFSLPPSWRDQPVVTTDLFALGSTLYEIFKGTSPYKEIPSDEVERLFMQKEFPDVLGIPCGKIITQCLCLAISGRFSGICADYCCYTRNLMKEIRPDEFGKASKSLFTAKHLGRYSVGSHSTFLPFSFIHWLRSINSMFIWVELGA